MQFRKIAAVAGSALMAGMTLAGAAMAATNVGNIASLAAPSGDVANFPVFVIGKTAQTSDVAGAVDIAVRMAAESKTTTTATTTGTSASVDGIERDGIAPGTTDLGSRLNVSISGGSAMPNNAVFLNTHYSKLKDGTYSWNSNDYDYREQVDASGLLLRHKINANNINGTEKLQVDTSDAKSIIYEYVFEKAINLSTATSAGTTGTTGTKEYTKPILLTMLGKDFKIVGVDSDSVVMLSGATGTAKKQGTELTGITSGDYTVYVTAASDNSWADFEIKDKTGNRVDTISGISEGSSKDSSVAGLTIKVTDVRVSGTDPATQAMSADVVIGTTGAVEHDYDGTADVDSTGNANEAFPGTARWGIQYTTSGAATAGGNGYIPAGARIQVVYKPKEAEYYKFGEKIALPNNFADLSLEGWNTDKFATITVKPTDAKTVYNSTSKLQVQQYMYGLEISSDKSGTIKSGGSYYDKAYVLVNASTGSNVYPIAIGYYDKTDGKILVNDAFRLAGVGAPAQTGYGYAKLDTSAASVNNNFTYAFTINNGETDFYLNVTVGNVTSAGAPVIKNMYFEDASASVLNGGINISYQNVTPWISGENLGTRFFRLGASDSSSEDTEVQAYSEGTLVDSGKKQQAELVTDAGILLLNPDSNGANNQVKVMIPSKTLGVKAYFGKLGAAATTGGTTTSDKILAVTSDVVRIDTEVSDTDKTGNNLVLVGGPCVNTLVAKLAEDAKFDYKCENGAGTQPVWPAENFALVKVVQDAFATGKVAVVVAGTRAQDTDLAALAIQSGKLSTSTAASVKLTGSDLNTLVVS